MLYGKKEENGDFAVGRLCASPVSATAQEEISVPWVLGGYKYVSYFSKSRRCNCRGRDWFISSKEFSGLSIFSKEFSGWPTLFLGVWLLQHVQTI